MAVIEGRRTAAYDGDLVVFLIGMRVNSLRAWKQWLPVARAMTPMLKELSADPDSGLLGFRNFFGLRAATMIQYWESVEKLQAFANDPGRTHRPAWTEFYRQSYRGGSVGIWHETYVVPAGHTETVYGNMPLTGLGEVAGVVPVNSRGKTASERLTLK
jgi:Monooxygenase af470-like